MSEQPPNSGPEQEPNTGDVLKDFVDELRRRRVIRVALVYIVVSWLVIQVAETTFPPLLLPAWSVTLVVILLVIGFPIAVILAWAYQVEPDQADHTATSIRYVVDKKRKLDFVVIAALGLIVVVLAYQLYVRDDETDQSATAQNTASESADAAGSSASRPSIGVLPFLNLSDDRENEYFADGLAEEVLNLLVRVREIDVAARTSSFYFKGKDVDIRTVATQLGVSNVLEGSVRRQGDRIRVTAQLIRADSGFHIWSDTYDRDFEDIFSIQDDIARQIVNALEVVISSESADALDYAPTQSLEAYQFYLQGRDYLRGEQTEARLTSAQTLFQQAIEIDSEFAEAYAGLCNSLLAMYDRKKSADYFEQAERACHRGLTLDANAGDVHTALGNLYRYSGQTDKAIAEFERAIALNQRNTSAYFGLADTYKMQNDLEMAEETLQRVIEIQPGYWRGHLAKGNFYYYGGRLHEAIDSFSQVVSLAPDNATGHLNLGSAYFLTGDFTNAASAWRRSIDLEPSTSAYLNVGSSYFFLGRFEDAAGMYEKAAELSPGDFEVWGALGDAYFYAGGKRDVAEAAYVKATSLGEELIRINPSDALTTAILSHYYAQLAQANRASELISRAVELAPGNMYVQYFSAVTHAGLGETDAAIEALEKALSLGYPALLVRPDAALSTIVEDSRVQELLGDADA